MYRCGQGYLSRRNRGAVHSCRTTIHHCSPLACNPQQWKPDAVRLPGRCPQDKWSTIPHLPPRPVSVLLVRPRQSAAIFDDLSPCCAVLCCLSLAHSKPAAQLPVANCLGECDRPPVRPLTCRPHRARCQPPGADFASRRLCSINRPKCTYVVGFVAPSHALSNSARPPRHPKAVCP